MSSPNKSFCISSNENLLLLCPPTELTFSDEFVGNFKYSKLRATLDNSLIVGPMLVFSIQYCNRSLSRSVMGCFKRALLTSFLKLLSWSLAVLFFSAFALMNRAGFLHDWTCRQQLTSCHCRHSGHCIQCSK